VYEAEEKANMTKLNVSLLKSHPTTRLQPHKYTTSAYINLQHKQKQHTSKIFLIIYYFMLEFQPKILISE
jgi:hypothetical protein